MAWAESPSRHTFPPTFQGEVRTVPIMCFSGKSCKSPRKVSRHTSFSYAPKPNEPTSEYLDICHPQMLQSNAQNLHCDVRDGENIERVTYLKIPFLFSRSVVSYVANAVHCVTHNGKKEPLGNCPVGPMPDFSKICNPKALYIEKVYHQPSCSQFYIAAGLPHEQNGRGWERTGFATF